MASVFQFPFRTVAEIRLPALVKNLVSLRALSQKEIIPVVKADAYGHGMVPIAKALVGRGGCRTVAVATLEEAMLLREKFPHGVTILVLSGFFPHQIEAYLTHQLTPVIHSLNHLKFLSGRRSLPDIHLKLDTGMHRLGIPEAEIPEAIKILEGLKVKLAGLASHFSESESLTSHKTDKQIELFESWVQEFRAHRLLATDAKIHIANSGGILRQKLGPTVAVRPGLALYGISPNLRIGNSAILTPVLQWKTRVLSIKTLHKGDTVGYGSTYRAKRTEKIAILPVGYADGYPRALSNKGEVLLGGKRVAVRGIVSMDLIAVDCSHVPSVREGMVATLIGKEGKHEVSAWDLALKSDTIAYEILCGLSLRVPRVYLD